MICIFGRYIESYSKKKLKFGNFKNLCGKKVKRKKSQIFMVFESLQQKSLQ